jgi:hypothetical protein
VFTGRYTRWDPSLKILPLLKNSSPEFQNLYIWKEELARTHGDLHVKTWDENIFLFVNISP